MLLLLLALLAAAPDPQNAGIQRELGKILFKQGRVDEAVVRFQNAVQLNPGDAVAWYNLAYASRKLGKFEQAADAYQHYTALSPDDPDGWFGLGESLREAGRKQEAIAAYQSYVAKEKRATEQKWIDQAQAHIKELTAKPNTTPVEKGDRAFAAKDYRAALFAYQDAIVADPKNVEALVKAGDTYAKMGHDPEALAQWNKALLLDPNNAAARAGIAEANERMKELAAKPANSEKPPEKPKTDDASAREHYVKGAALVRDRQYEEAVKELDQAIAAKPGFAVALVARGSARVALGRLEDAIADYSAAQKADPSLASPLFGLAEAYRGMGQNEKAADLYRQFAASKAPDADPGLKDYALQNAQALKPAP